MTKIVSGIIILRKTNSSAWPSDIDTGMNNWVTQYVTWLETAEIALEEKSALKLVEKSTESRHNSDRCFPAITAHFTITSLLLSRSYLAISQAQEMRRTCISTVSI
jgi:hypothetical protein